MWCYYDLSHINIFTIIIFCILCFFYINIFIDFRIQCHFSQFLLLYSKVNIPFVFKYLATCDSVFVLADTSKPTLELLYISALIGTPKKSTSHVT